MIFQALFLVASLGAMGGIFAKRKKGELSFRSSFFWILLWIAADVAVFWPNTTTIIANILGIGRGTDLVLYVSVVLVFFILFRLHVKLEVINRDITKVARRDALREEKNV